jgi:hypothetical protein
MLKPTSSPSHGRIECLEPRIAPAAALTILNPHTASFIASDGSRAYVQISVGTFTNANIGKIFTLTQTGVAGNTDEYQLTTLNLSDAAFGKEFQNTTIDIYAHPSTSGGNGTVDVGAIDAAGITLDGVRVHGNLGAIDAGAPDVHVPAIQDIDVLSMGLLGDTGGAPPVSSIMGGVREWTVFGNVVGAQIIVSDDGTLNLPTSSTDLNDHLSYIGHMDIRGSVIGNAMDNSGEIAALGGFKSLHIGGDLIGGAGDNSGEIVTERSILTLDIGGSVIGGAGAFSGAVASLVPGPINQSPAPTSPAVPLIRHTAIGGDVIGGAGADSGSLQGIGNNLITYGGEIMIHGSLIGGSGANSGYLLELNPIQTIIGGDIIGGAGVNATDSGEIHANRAVDFRIGGSLEGGGATDSGSIIVDKVFNSVHILRDLVGGSGNNSGEIHDLGERIGHVIVTGNIVGGSAPGTAATMMTPSTMGDSGSIVCDQGGILSVTVGGSVIGGAGSESAAIKAANGSIGPVSIGGNLTAGSGAASASIIAGQSISSIDIFGDINGDTATGVQFTGSASTGLLGSLTIGGDIKVPVAINFPATIIRVRGSIYADDSSARGAIDGYVIDKLQINGSILGVGDNPVDLLISGKSGALGDAIGALKVYGSVANANILAGYGPDPTAILPAPPYQVANPAARIGTVIVDGDWDASNLVAGATGTDGNFGTSAYDFANNPTSILSEIASIVIEGEAVGDRSGAHYGFVAQQIGAVSVANYAVPLKPGPDNDSAINIGPTGNLDIDEV